MCLVLHITMNHDGSGLLDEFGPDSDWAYWFDNDEDDEAYSDLVKQDTFNDGEPLELR
jgi:hypothetical protein